MRIELTNDDFKTLKEYNPHLSNSRIKQIIRQSNKEVFEYIAHKVGEAI